MIEFLLLFKEAGVMVIIVAFFVYRDYKREAKTDKLVQELLDFQTTELKQIAEAATAALTESTSVIKETLKYLKKYNGNGQHAD